MDDLIHLAITMTEMDTGITLEPEERQAMVDRIRAKVGIKKHFGQENHMNRVIHGKKIN